MQVLRTEVVSATTPSGQTVLRVTFCGEGGDCITVDMAKVEVGSDEAAVDRARIMLMQTATFSMAENEYDAESNGNFDEVAVTAANGQNGGAYIFEYRDGEGSRRTPPSTLPSFEAAREEAVRGAVDILLDLQPGTDDLSGWLARVRNESGELLCAIDVEEATAARQTSQ